MELLHGPYTVARAPLAVAGCAGRTTRRFHVHDRLSGLWLRSALATPPFAIRRADSLPRFFRSALSSPNMIALSVSAAFRRRRVPHSDRGSRRSRSRNGCGCSLNSLAVGLSDCRGRLFRQLAATRLPPSYQKTAAWRRQGMETSRAGAKKGSTRSCLRLIVIGEDRP